MNAKRHRILSALALCSVLLSPANAYYHYIHYTSRTSPYGPVPEKFDLSALPNKTLTFFVSDAGPVQYSQNDSFPSVLGQLRQAAQAWNGVDTSDLRVAFGGLYTTGTPQASPGAEVVFEDLAPGILGFGGPTARNAFNGTFVPVTRAVVHLSRDLTRLPGPNYTGNFFLVAVHEMGHALGLQHTFTSSVMSTYPTRATSLTRPLDADDIAGISVLYPAAKFAVQTGSITGRITANGQGLHMASVVAIASGRPAISALTNPDGTFRIDGIPPAQYFVYTHALPPGADIRSPLDPDGHPIDPDGAFDTTFSPGTTDPGQAAPVSVSSGTVADIGNLSVRPRNSVPIYAISTYSYFNQNTVAVKPGYLDLTQGSGTLVAQGTGFGVNGRTTSGLSVQILGGSAYLPNGVRPYTADGNTYLALDVRLALGVTPGPQHLIFSQPDYVYVLPSGLNLVQKQPPSVSTVASNGDGTVTVTGTNFAPDSQVYFDGLPASIATMDAANGRAVVTPPPGAGGQHSAVTVFNTDGQNSLFLQVNAPPSFIYDPTGPQSIVLNPPSLSAGSEAVIDIAGVNTRFAAGQVIVGFGSDDVFVRRVFVLSPTHLLVDVSIASNAAQVSTEASVISGFQVTSLPLGFQISAPNAGLPSAIPVLVNAATGQGPASPGAVVSVAGQNLLAGNGLIPSVTLNDQPVTVLFVSASQINFQIPAGFPIGPALLKVNNGANTSLPVAVNIDPGQ
ncbi:MAG: IPT/TIG domain-containing protein [Acidobacteriota bacterium]|nr:IPT/TIG domain-containing protein [Acidobacteriota bacterium]